MLYNFYKVAIPNPYAFKIEMSDVAPQIKIISTPLTNTSKFVYLHSYKHKSIICTCICKHNFAFQSDGKVDMCSRPNYLFSCQHHSNSLKVYLGVYIV